jgi:hypothetical protein
MGGKLRDSEERIKALREDPDFRALVESLKKLPSPRIEQYYEDYAQDESAGEEEEHGQDESGE